MAAPTPLNPMAEVVKVGQRPACARLLLPCNRPRATLWEEISASERLKVLPPSIQDVAKLARCVAGDELKFQRFRARVLNSMLREAACESSRWVIMF